MKRNWVLASALATLLVLPAQASGTAPGVNGKIAFDHGSEVWTMSPDGSNQASFAPGFEPAWSSDGRKLAWLCTSSSSICTADADGSNQATVGSGSLDRVPTWSPDGAFIAFGVAPFCSHGICSGPPQLWRMDADGSDRVFFRDGFDPDWSPNGTSIAYDVDVSGFLQVALVGSDNVPGPQLTSGSANSFEPSWSPDQKIAFTSDRDGNDEIYTMNQDGSGQTRLTTNSAVDGTPDWSPDGQKIVFSSNRDGNYEIYTMNADGSGVTRVTNDPATDAVPDWQRINPRVFPKGATPFRASLVPAFQRCTAPNNQHGAPLAFGSCSPPVQLGLAATIGPKSIGYVEMKVVSSNAPTSYDADVKVTVSISDVRRLSDQSDLTDSLDFPIPVRLTDDFNGRAAGGAFVTPATLQDFNYFNNPLRFKVPCAPTSDTTVGSTCSVESSVDALVPSYQGGAYVVSGDRAIWQLGQIAVYDGGEDGGTTSLDDNTVLAVQGVFAP